MSKQMDLDEFLSSQSRGDTVTLEAIPDKPELVKVTPFRDQHGCGCASSFELPREMIRSVTGTGQYHFCCGKRLEVAIVEFAEDASVPVADLMKPKKQAHDHEHGEHMGPGGHRGYGGTGYGGHGEPPFARRGGSVPPHVGPRGGGPVALVGRWRIPWTRCSISCIEVCTRFCSDIGWDCCEWETRCAVNCDGPYFDPFRIF